MQLSSDSAAIEARFVLATRGLIGEGMATARFGVAVSGGPDSMALLHLSIRAFPGRVAAVTVDHGLRSDSADEAAMVARWCAARDVPHATLQPQTPATGNIQSWARTQRYALIETWRSAMALDWIMTAHHADDQLETLLMRLNRGSGVSGLAGVRGRSGRVIRPLLGVTKQDLQAWAQAEGLPHVHDPSNTDPRFDRAALRTALTGIDWLDAQAASRSAAALAEAEAAIDWTVGELAARHVQRDGAGWRLDRTDLPREYLRRLVLHMLGPDQAVPRGETLDRAISTAQAEIRPVWVTGCCGAGRSGR